MLKHPRDVNYCTHDPRHRSSIIPVIVSGKEYPKGTCLGPRLSLLLWEIGRLLFYSKVVYYYYFFIISLSIFFILKDEDFISNLLMHFQKDLKLRMHQKFDNYRFTFGKGLPF